MNLALYRRELKGSWKLLVILAAVLTMYITIIIGMYDPDMAGALKQFETLMPELMAAVGMTGATDTLAGFLSAYLYGMLLLMFPAVYSIIRANGLVAKYVDSGSMACLLAAPVKRTTVVRTQMMALISGVLLLLAWCTGLEYAAAAALFPGELDWPTLLRLNLGLAALQLFVAGVCFLSSCVFGDTRHSLAVGAGVPVLGYLIQMLANMGGKLEDLRYATFFSLYQPDELIAAAEGAWTGPLVLVCGAAVCFAAAAVVFKRRDLHL